MEGFGQESRPFVLNASQEATHLASLAKPNPSWTNAFFMLKIVGTALSFLLLFCACNDSKDVAQPVNQETTNRSALVAFLNEGWNEKDLDAIDTYFADSIVRKVNSVNLASSKNELSANMQVYFTGFPDLRIEVNNMLSDGSEIYLSWTITGTNTGVFGELPPTGKKIRISGITRMDFDRDGKIAVEEVYYNELSLLQQMGHTLNPPVLE